MNYDLENNDSTEERFDSMSFRIVSFCYKLYVPLLHVQEIFYLSRFVLVLLNAT